MVRSRIDLAELVENRDRRPGAASHYLPVRVLGPKGATQALFTLSVIREAIERGKKNPEDWPVSKRSWWRRLFGGGKGDARAER